MTFDLHLKNLNSAHNCLTIRRECSLHQDLSGGNISLITWPWSWHLSFFWPAFEKLEHGPHLCTVRDRAIIFRMCVVLNKTFLLSLLWNTLHLAFNFKYVNYWWQQWRQINPSWFMPPALIKATYNDYCSISLLTVCLISLFRGKSIQGDMCYSLFPCYFSIIYNSWNSAYIVMYILHLIMTLPKSTFWQFKKVPVEHWRRESITDMDTHSSGQLTRPIWGLHNLLRPFPANFLTLGLNRLRYFIWNVKAILYCKIPCIDSWLSLI